MVLYSFGYQTLFGQRLPMFTFTLHVNNASFFVLDLQTFQLITSSFTPSFHLTPCIMALTHIISVYGTFRQGKHLVTVFHTTFMNSNCYHSNFCIFEKYLALCRWHNSKVPNLYAIKKCRLCLINTYSSSSPLNYDDVPDWAGRWWQNIFCEHLQRYNDFLLSPSQGNRSNPI